MTDAHSATSHQAGVGEREVYARWFSEPTRFSSPYVFLSAASEVIGWIFVVLVVAVAILVVSFVAFALVPQLMEISPWLGISVSILGILGLVLGARWIVELVYTGRPKARAELRYSLLEPDVVQRMLEPQTHRHQFPVAIQIERMDRKMKLVGFDNGVVVFEGDLLHFEGRSVCFDLRTGHLRHNVPGDTKPIPFTKDGSSFHVIWQDGTSDGLLTLLIYGETQVSFWETGRHFEHSLNAWSKAPARPRERITLPPCDIGRAPVDNLARKPTLVPPFPSTLDVLLHLLRKKRLQSWKNRSLE